VLQSDDDIHYIKAVLDVLAPSQDACMGSAEWFSDGHLGPGRLASNDVNSHTATGSYPVGSKG
jgi:hypothetical protein